MAVGRIPPKTDVEDDAYGAGWDGDTIHAPSQNAVYDLLQSGNWDARIKAWGQWDATGTLADSFNIASVTDNGVGDWSPQWDTDFTNTGYSCIPACSSLAMPEALNHAVGSCRIYARDHDGFLGDRGPISVIAIGDQ